MIEIIETFAPFFIIPIATIVCGILLWEVIKGLLNKPVKE